ncbi:MAG: hypothetical protein AAB739_01985 [Patescibacteria group bacterium]
METVRTTNIQNSLTAELNRLAHTNRTTLRCRIMEFLQSTDPIIIARFENAMQDRRLDLGIVSVVIDCRHELTSRALHGQGRKLDETRRGVENLVDAMLKLPAVDQDLLDVEGTGVRGEEPQLQQNELARELCALLNQQGENGVRQKVRAILTKKGSDVHSLNESNTLGAAIDYFRLEERRDPSGKAATILKIIEQSFII